MVVTYDDKNVNSGQIIAAVEKAGYGASLQQVKGKSAVQAVSPVDTAKKEYEAMRRRVIWSFVFTIPLFYISMGHMLGWPLPGVFLGTENSMVYALTLFLLVLPVAIINNKYYRILRYFLYNCKLASSWLPREFMQSRFFLISF